MHDLALARYRLRAKRLKELIARRLQHEEEASHAEPGERVEILLAAPKPPRFEIPISGARIRGNPEAVITLTEFIDFQSTASRRLQPVLSRILEHYPEQVRLALRDLPLPYHRYAWGAAEAAHCAGEQSAYWDYHDMLLLEQPKLSKDDLDLYARRLHLDGERFQRCLAEAPAGRQILQESRLAAHLGIERAPTLFVNGLYLAPPVDYESLAGIIEAEAGLSGRPTPARPPRVPEESRPIAADAPNESESEKARLPEVSMDRLPDPEAILDIPRREIERALAQRSSLEGKLETSSGVFSERRLLKLREVESGDLYDRFGLQPDDVLLLVDDQWVTDSGNPLWQVLESANDLTLLVMRGGRPHRYRYRIR